jgi:hypothetical protein
MISSIEQGLGLEDSSEATEERARCKANPAHFIDQFCMLQDQASEQAIPFRLYPCQADVLEQIHAEDRSIILKARQLGLTWLSAAYSLWSGMFHAQQFILAISIKEELACEWLQRVKFIFDHLPEDLKPPVYKRTESTLWFGREIQDTRGNTKVIGLNSQIKSVPTSKEAGRSKTLSLLILDEGAFIENADSIWRAAEPALEQSRGKAIVISTANGMQGCFFAMWAKAKRGENRFHPIFLPWSAHPDRDEEWYQGKLREAVREEDVHQEFPRTDQEAFVASGRPAFDTRALSERLQSALEPQKTGDLSLKDARPLFYENAKGFLKIWRFPEDGHRYVIGADVAEGLGHGDYSCAHVLDVRSLELVAEWHGHTDPDLFGVELYKLGQFYHGALLGVERNNHGLTTLTVLRQGHPIHTSVKPYPSLYFEETVDLATNKPTKHFGWHTNLKTRPLMIDDLARMIRERLLGLSSRETLEECLSFVIDDRGKPRAVEGQHDDRVIALAIAVQMAQQVGTNLLFPEFDPGVHTF